MKLTQNLFTILYITNSFYKDTLQHVWFQLRVIYPEGTAGLPLESKACKVSNSPLLAEGDLVKAVITTKNMLISSFKFYRFAFISSSIFSDFGYYTETGDERHNFGNDFSNYPAPYGTTSDVWSK